MTPDLSPLLEIKNLRIRFKRYGAEPAEAVKGINLTMMPGESIAVVGESGSGKSVTGLALTRLLPEPQAVYRTGEILLHGRDVLKMSPRELRDIRGAKIAYIFQEPSTSLNPVFTIRNQIAEAIRLHRPEVRDLDAEVVKYLDLVGIVDPAKRLHDYPHQLSGGMQQRVMIAMALSCQPELLVADEPTTALDVTIQAQIIRLLVDLSRRSGTALLFITHDLGVVAETCDRLLTMYAGEVVEDARVDDALVRPRHPYTSGLLRSIPRLSPRKSVLPSVPGRVPALTAMPVGCRFQPRCAHAGPDCGQPQALQPVDDSGRRTRCIRQAELALPGALA